jgi:predicted kinase
MGRGNRVAVSPRKDWARVAHAIDWSGPRLVVLVGLPGSGKSSWAAWASAEQNCQVVSADDIRLELFGSLREANAGGRKNHARVFRLLHERLAGALGAGQVAIADATNLYSHAREPLYKLAKDARAKTEIIFFDNTAEALRGNLLRGADAIVPEEAMQRLALVARELPEQLQGEGRLHLLS